MPCMIADIGVNHRNSRLASGGQQRHALVDRADHAGSEQRCTLGCVALHKVDHQQGRMSAEADAVAPDAAVIIGE
ncbi:hypothetical protein D3C76_1808510 [compost metagenome]